MLSANTYVSHPLRCIILSGYHWHRQDSNGMWSHKNTTAPATNVDDNGEKIDDPEKAAKNDDYELVGYFEVGDQAQ